MEYCTVGRFKRRRTSSKWNERSTNESTSSSRHDKHGKIDRMLVKEMAVSWETRPRRDYAISTTISANSPRCCTVITNPDDPNFDLEKILQKWEAELK